MKRTCTGGLALLRQNLSAEIGSEGERLKVCLLWTFLLGLLAHAYGFLNLLISHDSLHEFYWAVSRDWKLTLGRFVEPVLRYLMGEIVVLPWLTGLMSLLFIGLAVHLISKMFALDRVWENILLAGVCVTNITVTAVAATYIHDLAGDMLALLLCVAAAYVWHRMRDGFSWKYTILGGLCLFASLGLYQAYLAVMATVMCLYAMRALLRGASAKDVVLHLLRALPMAVLAVSLYLGCVAAIHQLFDVAASTGDTGNDMSLVGGNLLRLTELVGMGYRQVLQDLFVLHWDSVKGVTTKASLLVSVINAVLFVNALWNLLAVMKKRKVRGPEAVLVLALLALLPLAMTCVSVISTAFHNMVRYAYYLFYLLVLMLSREDREARWRQGRQLAILGLIAVVLFNNVQVSNMAYVKKDLELQATLSNMTRVLDRLEQYEDYVYGESQVAILGDPRQIPEPLAIGHIRGIMGLYNASPITTPDTIEDYFEIVLQYPIRHCPAPKAAELSQTEAYENMGIFPGKDCIATIDGVIVVRLS